MQADTETAGADATDDKQARYKPASLMAEGQALIASNQPAAILKLAGEVGAQSPGLADMLLQKAARGLPQHFELAAAFCNSGALRGGAALSHRRWAAVRRLQPKRVEAHVGFIDAALRHGQLDEAEHAANAAISALGPQPKLREARARVAEARGKWADAAQYWGEIADGTPDHPEAAANRLRAEQRAQEPPAEPAQISGFRAGIPALTKEETPEIKKLLMGFESLGRNCEFGLLQREFGGEPLGLLRFAGTSVRALKLLLASRFAGMGVPADCVLRNVHGEYLLDHKSSGWSKHTRVWKKTNPDETKLLAEQCRHARFLCAKLLKDLDRQSKIFVYYKPDLRDEEAVAIFTALRAYGPNRLMCVRLQDAAHPAGTIEFREDGLMVAWIDREGSEFRGSGWHISCDLWVHFCRTARARWGDAVEEATAEEDDDHHEDADAA